MSNAERNVHINITGDSADLNSELKKVGSNLDNLSDAVQGVSNDARKGLDGLGKTAAKTEDKIGKLPKAIGGTGRAAKPAANNVRNFDDRLKGLTDNAGDSSSVMSGLAGAFGLVSPEAQEAATALADTFGGLEAVGRSGAGLVGVLGPVALAVAALGGAYVVLKGNLEEANAKLETNRQRLKSVMEVSRQVKEAVLLAAMAEANAAEARGDIDGQRAASIQQQLDEIAIAQSATDIFGARREALEAESRTLKQNLEVQREGLKESQRIQKLAVSDAVKRGQAAAEQMNIEAMKRTRHAMKLNETRQQTLNATVDKYTAAVRRRNAADKEAAAVTAQSTQAQTTQTDTIDTTAAALATLQSAAAKAQFAQLSDRNKIIAGYFDEIEAMREVAKEHESNTQIRAALELAEFERRKQLRQELSAFDQAAEQERIERIRNNNAEISAGMRDLAAASGDAFMAMGTAVAGSNKQAATRAFNVGKALSGASISIKYAEALMAAQAGGPIIGPIQSAIATATFAASMARLAATKPSFHAGTGMVRAPSGVSEMNARLRDGEAVATPLGAEILGRGNIERANAGIGGGGNGAPVVFQYEHRQFSRFIRDHVRMRGPLAKESQQGRAAGHRSR